MDLRESRTGSEQYCVLLRGREFSTLRGHTTRTGAGFTIIELLIVIVVIAILASITAVVYAGIQDKAYNTKIVAAVDAYSKSIQMYHIQNGSFPNYGTTWGSCLGRTSDYPATGDWPEGACTIYRSSGGQISHDYASDEFDDELSAFVGGLPDPKVPEVREDYSSGGYSRYRGIYYEHQNNASGSSVADWAYVEYVIKGQHECPNKYVDRFNGQVTFCSRIIWATDGGTD